MAEDVAVVVDLGATGADAELELLVRRVEAGGDVVGDVDTFGASLVGVP